MRPAAAGRAEPGPGRLCLPNAAPPGPIAFIFSGSLYCNLSLISQIRFIFMFTNNPANIIIIYMRTYL